MEYDGYQRALTSTVYKIFWQKKTGSGVNLNEQLAEDLHKPVIRCFLIDVFNKYAWIKPLRDKKKGETVLNAFMKIANESNYQTKNYGLIKENNFIINLCKNR